MADFYLQNKIIEGVCLVWNTRFKKATPEQIFHCQSHVMTSVYSAKVVGTQNAHNLNSISTDGNMCNWSLDMLAHPQETLELQHKQSKAVATTCLSFP